MAGASWQQQQQHWERNTNLKVLENSKPQIIWTKTRCLEPLSNKNNNATFLTVLMEMTTNQFQNKIAARIFKLVYTSTEVTLAKLKIRVKGITDLQLSTQWWGVTPMEQWWSHLNLSHTPQQLKLLAAAIYP